MIINNKKIAIIGGGPGGLTLARLLQLQGASVKVYERDIDQNQRQQGATLDLHEESGLKALTAAGLIEEFKKHYRPGADKIKLMDEQANVHFSDHNDQAADFGHPHFRPEIDRGPLKNLLMNSLEENTILWDSQFMAMKKLNQQWVLKFKNGETAIADLVIAADGANSKARPYLSSTAAIYSGVTVIEGNIYHAHKNVPKLNNLLQNGKIFALGKEKSIILSAKGDGSLSFYTGIKAAAEWIAESGIDWNDKNSVLAWFKTQFADWSPIWQELFATDEMYLVARSMRHFPLNQSWEPQPDLTMIGDAAHLMPPYAGEGVNMAMLDALELSRCLSDNRFSTLLEAIAGFEQQMCKRAAEVTAFTLEQTEALLAQNALPYLVNLFSDHA
ncbi:NAD(P)/FAD-dependent oxidoreductase [Pedobacter sp. PLR]|uniref:FAD-dependent oxidoreductase n=1 Tax=Pedobacter sp. PLR TaxID=2994465 RepID=UPI002247F6C6|nr:NAD(P)/FAD-dependent oxidoreductase [Pedobacter sp. PLR]MCX2449781.1 NAD(P)/FAD-dependent oxidoreductase [Pedobacter sp. PLR]